MRQLEIPVFVNGYYKKTGWEVIGLHWKTGKTVHRVSFGRSNVPRQPAFAPGSPYLF